MISLPKSRKHAYGSNLSHQGKTAGLVHVSIYQGNRTVSTCWLGEINPIPIRGTNQCLRVRNIPLSQDRLTHVQLLFTWSPFWGYPIFDHSHIAPRQAARSREASDIFARVGAFSHLGCQLVRRGLGDSGLARPRGGPRSGRFPRENRTLQTWLRVKTNGIPFWGR